MTRRRSAPVAWTEAPAVLLLALAAAGVGLLLAEQFSPLRAAGLGGALGLALLLASRRPHGPRAVRADRRAVAVVLLVVAAFAVGGHLVPGERLFTDRDPATYTVTARWLVDNPTTSTDTRPELFGAPPGADVGLHSLGFEPEDDKGDPVSVPQGTHAVPALAALSGALAGDRALLAAGALVGAAALLALFGLARRLVPDWAAATVTAAAAVSLPMVAFSWTLFTEPLSLALALAACSVLLDAVRGGGARDLLLAGALAGGVALSRADGPLLVAGLLAATGATAVLSARRSAAPLVVLLGAAGPAALGVADVVRLSPPYAADLRPQLMQLGALVAVAAATATSLSLAVRLRLPLPRPLVAGAVAAVVVAATALATRPLWQVSRQAEPSPGIEQLQAAAGLPLDGRRDYAELTLSWFAWYWGWPALVTGLAGVALLLARGLTRDAGALVPLLTLGPGAVALVAPAIAPDQVWAVRRLLVAVVPLLLLGAAAVLARLWRRARPLAALLGIALVGWPAVVAAPLVGEPDGGGELAAVTATCARLGPTDAVVLTDGAAVSAYAQTLRAFCERPVLGVLQPSPEVLAAVAATLADRGLRPAVVTLRPQTAPWAGGAPPAPAVDLSVQRWEAPLLRAPGDVVLGRRQVWVGDVAPDGTVVPR